MKHRSVSAPPYKKAKTKQLTFMDVKPAGAPEPVALVKGAMSARKGRRG